MAVVIPAFISWLWANRPDLDWLTSDKFGAEAYRDAMLTGEIDPIDWQGMAAMGMLPPRLAEMYALEEAAFLAQGLAAGLPAGVLARVAETGGVRPPKEQDWIAPVAVAAGASVLLLTFGTLLYYGSRK